MVPSVADKWRDLGVQLLHPTSVDNRVLEVIAADYPHSVEECCKRMFKEWLRSQNDASWNQLIKAINAVGLNSLATELEKHIMGKVYICT